MINVQYPNFNLSKIYVCGIYSTSFSDKAAELVLPTNPPDKAAEHELPAKPPDDSAESPQPIYFSPRGVHSTILSGA